MNEWLGAVTGITGSLVAILGSIYTYVKLKQDKQQGVVATENEARRDTVADRDSLINQFQEELQREREARQRLEARVSSLESSLSDEREYAQSLRDHIYRQLPPPPPARWGSTIQPV